MPGLCSVKHLRVVFLEENDKNKGAGEMFQIIVINVAMPSLCVRHFAKYSIGLPHLILKHLIR